MRREQPYTIREAVEVLGVSDKTIHRWLDQGRLQEHGRDEDGHILISVSSVQAEAARQGKQSVSSQNVQVLGPAV